MKRLALAHLIFLLPLAASPLDAQECDQWFSIVGQVTDAVTGVPVAGAAIEVTSRYCRGAGSVQLGKTDSEGKFHLAIRFETGSLRASQPGFVRSRPQAFRMQRGETMALMDVSLAPIDTLASLERAIPLDGVVVTVEPMRRSPLLVGFDERVARGLGQFITRDDIERRRPSRVSDLLTTLTGVEIGSSGQGISRVVRFKRTNCEALLFLNGNLINKKPPIGMPAMPYMSVDDVAAVSDLEGIEVYSGASSVPVEFIVPDQMDCGVVAIWTRRSR